jgi:hypothetical protein
MRKIILIAQLITSAATTAVLPQETKTVFGDNRTKTRLLGSHRFSLQWISWDYFGKATVTERRGTLFITGSQKSRKNADYVAIDGKIIRVDAKQFVFDGKITTKVSSINDGEPCVRNGEMTFKITSNRKYWRLQEMLNPCTNVETDYVDIFF